MMCKITKINFEFVLLVCIWIGTDAQNRKEPKIKPIATKRPFDDFIKKTSLTYHFKKFTSQKLAGQSRRLYGKSIMQAIDRTDELIQFDIDKATERDKFVNASRRYMEPPRVLNWYKWPHDQYHLRGRLYELMKQTIYEVRDSLPYIIELREKYNWQSLYKMGFLISKMDDVAKQFTIFSQKFFITHRNARDQRANYRDHLSPILLLEIVERQLNTWFEFDLLADVLRINDDMARKTLNYMKSLEELDTWFTDSFDDVYHVYKVAAKDLEMRNLERVKKAREKKIREERMKNRKNKNRG